MDTLKTIVLALVVSGLVLGGYVLVAPKNAPGLPNLGSITGPDIASPYLKWGSVATYRASVTMKTATTTLCAIESPVATSTITSASFIIGTGTSTAATIDIGYGTTPYATSTNLKAATSIGSGAQGDANWTAAGAGTGDDIIAPNTYIIVKTASTGLGGYTYGGHCNATFDVL